jgi:hypothetical protein
LHTVVSSGTGTAKVDADEVTHRHRVVQRLFHGRVRQVEPLLQKVHPQHPLQPYRWTTVAGLGIKRLDLRAKLTPRHNDLHLRQKLRPPRLLAVPLKTSRHRKALLFRHRCSPR